MIIDALANMEFYKGLNEQLFKGLTFLKENDLASLPLGRYEIDGDAVFAIVQEYETHLPEECRWEAHYNYTDIQYVVEGSEKIGWSTLDDVAKTEDLPEDDVYFFDAEGDHFVVQAGQFAVFAPQDAHRPGVAVEGPAPIKKVVVKVAM
jgi:YhcH/YjgK/YiaL family protein